VRAGNRADDVERCRAHERPSTAGPSFIGILSVPVPESTCTTSAPRVSCAARSGLPAMSSLPMKTLHSIPNSAAAVAVATPCCPAPVSAITLALPIHFAGEPVPCVLLILCAPVCARSRA